MQLAVNVTVLASGETVTSKSGTTDSVILITIPSPQLWTPSSPFLYDLLITVGDDADVISSYFGMRSFTLGKVKHPIVPDTGAEVGIDRPGYVTRVLFVHDIFRIWMVIQ